MKKKEYKISVIIPVYNVEKYLEETIESVVNQTIGFDNIQMILVNDGSPDNSEEICLKYKEKYPDNVVYVKQENAGVSSAKNNGLKHATGKYVNFFDSDDIWDKNAYEKAVKFLDSNLSVDLVAFRLKFFEKSTDYHALDYKFTRDGIVDVNEEPSSIVLHVSTAVIRREAIPVDPFDSRLRICEDTKVLYQIILNKLKYGIISSSNYNYRKREDQSSAIQGSKTKVYWYTDTIEYAHKYLIKLSMEKFGKVIPYVQYFIMYELQWRIKGGIKAALTLEQKEMYRTNLRYLMSYIDDTVIAEQRNIGIYEKIEAYFLKYDKNLNKKISIKDNLFYVNNVLVDEVGKIANSIEIFEMKNDNDLLIIGNVSYIGEFNIYYEYNGVFTKLPTILRKSPSTTDLNVDMNKREYKTIINVKDGGVIKFYLEIDGVRYKLNNKLVHFSRLSGRKNAYYYEKKYLFTQNKDKNQINIRKNPSILSVIGRELNYLARIFVHQPKVGVIRTLYWLTKPFMSKNIFLFADREFMAGDSAEVLFKYFNKTNKDKKIKTYFAVEKSSLDYKRMQEYGRVVAYHGLKYKMLFLHAKFLISSHADGYVNNEFGKKRNYYVDFYRFKYVYLTHGILLHDSSLWLNRINKNFALNVATSPMEYESLLDDKYFFEPDQIIKTGMPRYDNLINMKEKEENKILFMPSWRSTLTGPVIPGSQHRQYNPKFKESEYFLFYKRLFSDPRFLDVLKESGLKVKFCIHPSFRAQFHDFVGNEYVEFAIDVNSQYETVTSKFLVTDYSSAACDFAYLNKPVIYANFDFDHIFDVHYYNKGYFDYDKHGFGPNCKDYDSFLDEIIKLIKSGCKLDKKYEKRMKNFFFYRDNKNSQRVYKEIMKLNKKL